MDPKLIALHKHWCIADSVKQFVSAKLPNIEEMKIDEWAKELGEMQSSFHRMSVWYSLIYVVIEGYKELGYSHDKIDTLLTKEENVNFLRLFRNATFHYQKEPLTDKEQKFLIAEDSEIWIRDLNKAFESFFIENLPIKEYLIKYCNLSL